MKLIYVTILRGIVLLLSIFLNLALAIVGSSVSCKPVHCFMVAFITEKTPQPQTNLVLKRKY